MTLYPPLALVLACLATGCGAPTVYGRVVSDVRVANGYISIDRCLLKQGAYHGLSVSECETEDYYIGKAVIPVRSEKAAWPR